MKIEFMGVGSGLSPELGNNNALLFSADSDRQLLIDCGFSTPPVLTQRENGLFNISDILITHVHSDHVGGLELMGFTTFYVYRNFPNFRKITLHVPTESLKNDIWQILEKGMKNAQTVETGDFEADIETYFDISVSPTINLDGFKQVRFEETEHVRGMEAYSLWIGDKVYYSSDTVKLPPKNATLIFQDCQLFNSPTSVHTEYDTLNSELDESTKQKTWLMHYGFNNTGVNPVEHGFKGFVKRFDVIDLEPYL